MRLAKRKSQKRLILEYLQRGHQLSARRAYRLFDCMRLAGRIFELRREGWVIQQAMWTLVDSGKRVASYWMEDEDAKDH